MAKDEIREIGKWLQQRDSHTAYDVAQIAEELEPLGVKVEINASGEVSFTRGEQTAWRGAMSGKEFLNGLGRTPKGPAEAGFDAIDAGKLWLMGGWQVSSALRAITVGGYSNSLGRGTAFRQDLAAILSGGGK